MGESYIELMRGAKIAIETCMGIKAEENLLIVTDTGKINIANALAAAGHAAGAETSLIIYTPRKMHAEEPPRPVKEAMKSANAVLAPTTYSITHTNAREEANKSGARIATMPMITEDIMIRGAMTANYAEVQALTEKLAALVSKSKTAKVTASAGTSITAELGRKALADTGIFHTPGSFGNLPGGEAFIAPIEGTCDGVLVIDGSLAGLEVLSEPVKWVVKKGRVQEVTGGPSAEKFNEVLKKADENAWSIAEFGIGTNAAARLIGNPLEDEKVLGTVHFAVGNNLHMGGKQDSKIHVDGIIKSPTVQLDGHIIIKDGKVKI